MKNRFWIVVVLIGVISLGGMFFIINKRTESNVIKVGVILPLTGDLASLGGEVKKGIEIAVDEANNSGSLLKVIYEDDWSLSSVAGVKAANKLIHNDKIEVGLTMWVDESRPIAPIFIKNKIPLIILWDSNRFIKEAGDYIYSNGFSTEKAGEIMGKFAYSELNLRKVALLKHVDSWSEIISEAFENSFKNMGGTIIYKKTLQPSEIDYKSVIANIKKRKVDGVYFALIPPNSVSFLKQAKELKLKSVLLTGDALIQEVIDAAGQAAEGVYFTNIFTEPEKASKLTEKYKNKYNKNPLNITLVSFGYDGIKKIMESAHNRNKSFKESFISIFGKDRTIDRTEAIYQVVNGKPKKVKFNVIKTEKN